MEGEQELGFWHVIVRDVAYGQVPRASRAAKHVTAVTWLEGKAGERVEDVAEVLAYHTTEAIALAKATGDVALAAQLAPAARRYSLLAAERALGLDMTKAVRLFERAVDLTPSDDPDRPRVMLRYADALSQAGRYPESAEAAEEARTGFEATSDAEGAAGVLMVIGLARSRTGDIKGSLQLAQEGVALLETQRPGPPLVAALGQLAAANVVDAQLPPAIEAADRALALADELGLPVPARALGYRGSARAMLGERDGYAELERAIQLLIESGASSYAATAMHNLAVAIWERDGAAAALPKMTEARRFGRERGIGLAATSAVIESAWLGNIGSLDESLSLMDSIRDELQATGQVLSLLRTDELRAQIFLARGQRKAATEAAATALTAARQLGDHRSLAIALQPAIESGVVTAEEAQGMLGQLADDPVLRDDHDYVARLPGLVREAISMGDVELARRLAANVQPKNPLYERSIREVKAELAEANGDVAGAATLYAEAAAGWLDGQATWHRSACLLGQARCLIGTGDDSASDALHEARAAYVQMDATARVAECDELMARLAR